MNTNEVLKLALENSQPSFLTPGWTLVRNEDITALREALAKPDFWEGYVPEPVKLAQQEPMALEPAPDNSLPKWDECALRVSNSELIAKRVTEGGYGPDHNAKLASALHRFIYEYDDADPYRSGWFLHRLEQVISECTSPPAQRTWVGLTDEERKLVRNSVGYNQFVTAGEYAEHVQKATEFKLLEKNT